MAPVLVATKIFIQSTWLQRLDWDEPLVASDASAWQTIRDGLPEIADMRVPRWLHRSKVTVTCELHKFADASERVYAEVVYLRTTSETGDVHITLHANTKVAPLKQLSLPRLELCAAVLVARLASRILTALGEAIIPMHF